MASRHPCSLAPLSSHNLKRRSELGYSVFAVFTGSSRRAFIYKLVTALVRFRTKEQQFRPSREEYHHVVEIVRCAAFQIHRQGLDSFADRHFARDHQDAGH